MQMGPRAFTYNWSLLDAPDRGRPAGYEMAVMPQTVSKLCEQGALAQAVEALGVLVQKDYRISQALLYAVVKECVVQRDLVLGRRVHAFTVKGGYEWDTFLCNHIMRMYASHGRLEDAMDVFGGIPKPNAFTWSAILHAHVQQGQDKKAIELYLRMRRTGVKTDAHVFVAAIQACARGADLKSGQQVHADLLASGLQPDLFVCSCLVDMYAKCGSLEEAQRVFDGLVEKDVVTWNAMIAGYSQQGMGEEALRLYETMQEEGMVALDSVTFACLLQACASVGTLALEKGRELHAQISEGGHQAGVFVGSSLVNMYAKCGSLEDAQGVFDELPQKNVVTWNAMIAGYSQRGMGQEALRLYMAMQEDAVVAPDSVTFVCLLQACASVGTPALEKGKQLHAQIRERGLQLDVCVASSLVNMYAKCERLEDARGVFDAVGEKNVVMWTAMIAGYSQQGRGQEALGLYRAMQDEGIVAPDPVTFVCLLQACADVAALHLGRQLHAQIKQEGLQAHGLVACSLINMYGKSGSMVDAQQVFAALPERDDAAWNALIAGYARQGDSEVVFRLFHRMREDRVQPNSITFLSVLTVCSHAGLVNKGQQYLDAMSRQYAITPTAEHYTCIVDLLGRAGQLDEALSVIRTMPVPPDAAVWHTLLGACRKWSNVEVGCLAFDEALKLDRKDAAAYVLMSNVYSGAQMWEQAQDIQTRRQGIRAWKQAGQSWWTDMEGLLHTFLVGDTKHPESECIYTRLEQLISRLSEDGYVPHVDFSPRYISDQNEKLAVAMLASTFESRTQQAHASCTQQFRRNMH